MRIQVDQGGDDVIGFSGIDFDPRDLMEVEALLDMWQGQDRFEGFVVRGPMGLVLGVVLFAVVGAVFSVEHHEHLRTGKFVANRHTQQGEETEDGGQVTGLATGTDFRGKTEGGAPQQVVAVDQEQGRVRHRGIAFRHDSATVDGRKSRAR